MRQRTVLKSIVIGLMFVSLSSTADEYPHHPMEEPSIKRQQQLRQLLLQDCSVCHGKLLQGSELAPPLTPETLGDKSERVLVKTIIEGHKDKGHKEIEMPSWDWKLEDYEARWMVKLIRSGGISGKRNQH